MASDKPPIHNYVDFSGAKYTMASANSTVSSSAPSTWNGEGALVRNLPGRQEGEVKARMRRGLAGKVERGGKVRGG